MNENKLKELIKEVIREELRSGVKVGDNSIYIRPTEIDLDGNIIKNVSTISFGIGTISDVSISRISADNLGIDDNLHIGGNLTVDGTYPTSGGSSVGSLSELSINVTKNWQGYGISSLGTLIFGSDTNLYGGSNTLITSDNMRIGSNLIVDGSSDLGNVNVDSMTIGTNLVAGNSSIGITSTIPISATLNLYVYDGIIIGYGTVGGGGGGGSFATAYAYPLGFSGYNTGTASLSSIINTLNAYSLNIYRMAFNPSWNSTSHPYSTVAIQYMLDNWGGTIIIDRNHLYPPTTAVSDTFASTLQTAIDDLIEVYTTFGNNPRIIIEMVNEYVNSDFRLKMNTIANSLRVAGYTGQLLADKWTFSWSSSTMNTAYSPLQWGMHWYFDSESYGGATQQMGYALAYTFPIVNTEIGAHSSEYGSYNSVNVACVSSFMTYCQANSIGMCIWMNENLTNLPYYLSLGLTFPTATA